MSTSTPSNSIASGLSSATGSRAALIAALAIVVGVVCMVLTACQTVQGMGKDISYAGEKTANLFESDNNDDQPRTLPQN